MPTTTKRTNHKIMTTLNATRAEAPKMYETENDLSKENRTQLNALLNQRVASAVDLQMQMKQAHWNVKGPSFIGLHELFDKVAEAVEGYVDEIAERIVQLGGVAEGTVRMAAARRGSSNIRRRFPRAWRISKAWPARCPPLAKKPAARSMKRTNWMTPTRRICSPRFRAALTNGCGSSRPIPRQRNKNMTTPISKFAAIVQTPVFPKTLHQFRPTKAAANPETGKARQHFFQIPRHARGSRHTRNENVAQRPNFSCPIIFDL